MRICGVEMGLRVIAERHGETSFCFRFEEGIKVVFLSF